MFRYDISLLEALWVRWDKCVYNFSNCLPQAVPANQLVKEFKFIFMLFFLFFCKDLLDSQHIFISANVQCYAEAILCNTPCMIDSPTTAQDMSLPGPQWDWPQEA